MLDNNKKINLAHLHSLHPRVTFHCVDLYAPEALELVRDAVALHGSTAAAVVGVHLCGDLARRAMQLWDESRSDALVLSPCCLVREVGEHKRPAGRFGYGLSRLARTSGGTRTTFGVSFCFTTRGWRTEGTSLVVTTRRWRVRIPPDANATSTPWMMGARVEGRDGTSTGTRT